MKTPKQTLLEHANENPRQFIVVSETNGTYRFDTSFISPHEALFMLHLLTKKIQAVVDENLNQKPGEKK